MNRRSFLKTIVVAGGGIAAGLSILPNPKINPAWVAAEYEETFLFSSDALELLMANLTKVTEYVWKERMRKAYLEAATQL